MRTLSLIGLLLLAVTFAHRPAAAEGDDDEARILAIELRRGPARDLSAWLGDEAAPQFKALALRALGRIAEDDPQAIDMLGEQLARPPKDEVLLRALLLAAGITRAPALGDAVLNLLAFPSAPVRAEAAAAVGWLKPAGAAEALVGRLDDPHAGLRHGALVGLARLRDADPARAQRAASCAQDPDPRVREAARFAGWMMAAGRREAARATQGEWMGDIEACQTWVALLSQADAGARLDAVRILGVLLPARPLPWPPGLETAEDLSADPDERVVQDWLARIVQARVTHLPATGRALAGVMRSLGHDDPKVRGLAAEALGARADAPARAALERRFEIESDARVRETLAVELARCGNEQAWARLSARGPRPQDDVLCQLTDVRVALASPRPEALAELLAWADPGASQRTDLGAAAWMEILGGLKGRKAAGLDAWLAGLLDGGYAVDPFERHFVLSEAIGLAASERIESLVPLWRAFVAPERARPAHEDVRTAVAVALGGWLAVPGEEAWRPAAIEDLRRLASEDESPWVRRAAREAHAAAGLEPMPEATPGRANAWRGLPRAREPWQGVDPEGAGEWLDEAQILKLARWIQAEDPLVAIDTTQGTFHVRLFADVAPVHCVNLLQAVRNGVYSGTRWHRVVPDFVIQGGDPHGHGAGNAGWTVPDELSARPYVRGVLGMPKSTKDDGGCQLFFMHSHYPPLDERYTAYGEVVSGMEVVDRIRVGDFILSARVLRAAAVEGR